MLLIFYISSLQKPSMPMSETWNIDKVYHSIEYCVFSILAFIAFVHTPIDRLSKKALLWALILGSLYGATDEIHQYFVTGRQASFIDWISDLFGASIGISCVYIFNKLRNPS